MTGPLKTWFMLFWIKSWVSNLCLDIYCSSPIRKLRLLLLCCSVDCSCINVYTLGLLVYNLPAFLKDVSGEILFLMEKMMHCVSVRAIICLLDWRNWSSLGFTLHTTVKSRAPEYWSELNTFVMLIEKGKWPPYSKTRKMALGELKGSPFSCKRFRFRLFCMFVVTINKWWKKKGKWCIKGNFEFDAVCCGLLWY